MKILKFFTTLLLGTLLILSCKNKNEQQSGKQKMMNFFNKEKVTILVTDSGLGGMSIVAGVTERLKKAGLFREADIIFFNAQPHATVGYNSMKKTEHKIAVFNRALEAMEKNYHPDILLIACNTLSVLYDYTEFSKKTEIPVVGIVETGVRLIKEKMKERKAKVIIFATKTTVRQNQHKTKLMEQGLDESQIITKACPRLAGRIENASHSDTTVSLVKKYVDEALAGLKDTQEPVYVSYNCTHYGYVDDLFRQAFKEKGVEVAAFLDPNPMMADFIFDPKYIGRYPQSEVNVQVVSQTKISPMEVKSIARLIKGHSAQTAEALRKYRFTPRSFEWQSIVKGK